MDFWLKIYTFPFLQTQWADIFQEQSYLEHQKPCEYDSCLNKETLKKKSYTYL